MINGQTTRRRFPVTFSTVGPSRPNQLALARRLLAEKLCAVFGEWTPQNREVCGPGTVSLMVEDRHEGPPGHIDIGFVLNRERTDSPIIWDCATGIGESVPEALSSAIDTWIACTFPVLRELLTQRGKFAAHIDPHEPRGCPGWHVIHGPLNCTTWSQSPTALGDWMLDVPLLSIIGPSVAPSFTSPWCNGVKVVLGGGPSTFAEVRVNGEWHQAASEFLESLDWPRMETLVFCRFFWLFLPSKAPGA